MNTQTQSSTKYQHLVMWCHMMGSMPYYTEAQIAKATKDNAPVNAIYWSDEEKRWNTFDEVGSAETKWYFNTRGLY